MSKTSATTPLVTVIVTTKNNSQTIAACLSSITAQTYPEIELIVVDNNSTDDTVALSKKYTKHVYTKGPERSAQRNYAVNKAKGQYVLIIDSDMELGTKVVEQCVAAANEETKALIIPEQSFGEGFWSQCKALERSFYVGVDWIEAPRFFDRSLYLEVGGYDEKIVGGEDWDLHVRIKAKTNVGHINEFIHHNEGMLTIREIIKSRLYYAKGFGSYYKKDDVQQESKSGAAQAIGVFKLFFSRPGHLFSNPVRGAGMLFMKVVEFGTIGVSIWSNHDTKKN